MSFLAQVKREMDFLNSYGPKFNRFGNIVARPILWFFTILTAVMDCLFLKKGI